MELPKEKLLAFVIVFVVVNIDCNFASSNRDGERARRPSRSLSAEVVNSTTITLKWPKAAATATGPQETPSCPVKRYLIRLKNQAMKRVRTWEVDGEKQSVSFHGLLPDTTYSVRLMVVNCEGRSKPSRWVSVRTSDQPTSYRIRPDGSTATDHRASETTAPGQPRKVTSRAFSDYVVVSWEPPADDVEVRGYVIGYGEGVPDVNWQYLEGHRRNVTVKNLKKSTQYVISVRAFNNIGKGPVVYDLVYTRDNRSQESGSLPAPTHLRSKVLSHTTVWLQWTDPSLGRQQTVPDNRYYSVHYQPVAGTSGNDRSVVVKDLHVVLYNLHPATGYEFKVGLVKDGLTSAFSDVIVNRTLETAPFSPPRSVTVTRLNSDPSTVVINWRPPKQPNGNITDYTVFYTQNVELPYDRWLTETVRRKTDLTIQGLNETVTYYFRVHARNAVGPGPKSDIVRFDSKAAMPNVAQSATRAPSSSIRVSTNGNANSDHVIIPHVITVNDTDGEDEYDYNTENNDNPNNNNNNNNNNNKGEAEEKEGDSSSSSRIQGASLIHEIGDSSSAGEKKTKREPNLGPMAPGASTSDPAGGAAGLLDGSPHRQQHPFVQFRSVLSYRISVFIAWPESTDEEASCSPSSSSSSASSRPRGGSGGVTGYRLRYRRVDDAPAAAAVAGEYVTRGLAENVALIENLAPNAKYRYQVQYVTEELGTESPWSQEQELDTGAAGKTD